MSALKHFVLIFIVGVFSFGYLQGQNKNVQLLGKRSYNVSTYGQLSDIWGHVDSLGNEYALVGARNGVSIVDVTDPNNLNEVFYTTGAQTIWRDIKTWNNHAYITNEYSGGLMIIDMSNLPGAITSSDVYSFTGVSYPFGSAHNLYIDENGVAYLFGTDYSPTATIFLGLNNNPKIPVELGYFDTYYLHDGMVRGDTLWGGAVNQGMVLALDVSNKSNPVILKTKFTSGFFTHNCWISDDGHTVFTTDEKSAGSVDSYDVSDLSNIQELDQYRSNPGSLVIPHNTHVYGNFLVTSYYRDGVTIVDATKPDVMVEVGNYDTSPLSGSGFNGCWGAYPYLPSKNLLASDIENGLFVLGVDYAQGVYIEGHIKSFSDSSKIANVKVISLLTSDTMFSNLNGFYKNSFPDSGFYRFTYSAPGYISDTIDLYMKSGVAVVSDVYLKSVVPFKLEGMVYGFDWDVIGPDSGANVLLSGKYHQYGTLSKSDGTFSIDSVFEDDYDIVAWEWNSKSACIQRSIISGDSVEITIDKGYQYDDMTFDNDWITTTKGNNGAWEKEVFSEDILFTTLDYPLEDVNDDCYRTALITGKSGSVDHDVDGGPNIVVSRDFYLEYGKLYLKWSYWFKNDAPSGSDDTLSFKLISDQDTIDLFQVYNSVNLNASTWVDTSILISNYNVGNSFRLYVEIDDSGNDDLLEAGIDHIYLERSTVGISELISEKDPLNLYPNPAQSILNYKLEGSFNPNYYEIINIQGQIIQNGDLSETINNISLEGIPEGIYLIKIFDLKGKLVSGRFVHTEL